MSVNFKVGGKSYLKPSRDFQVAAKCFQEVGGMFSETYHELCQTSKMGRPWQIKFPLMYVDVIVFYIICSLTYFHTKILVRVKQKILTCIPREHNHFGS